MQFRQGACERSECVLELGSRGHSEVHSGVWGEALENFVLTCL